MISGIVCETRGNAVGRQHVEAIQLLFVVLGIAIGERGRILAQFSAARAMILSSTSVKFMT